MIIKLGLVDDSHMLREYFVDFFKRCPEFEVLFSVGDLKDLYRVKNGSAFPSPISFSSTSCFLGK